MPSNKAERFCFALANGLFASVPSSSTHSGQPFTNIRRLLIIGAMSRLNWMGRKSTSEDSWLARISWRKPRMLVAIALANKMGRTMWAMLTKNEDYRVPAQAGAA